MLSKVRETMQCLYIFIFFYWFIMFFDVFQFPVSIYPDHSIYHPWALFLSVPQFILFLQRFVSLPGLLLPSVCIFRIYFWILSLAIFCTYPNQITWLFFMSSVIVCVTPIISFIRLFFIFFVPFWIFRLPEKSISVALLRAIPEDDMWLCFLARVRANCSCCW